MHASAITSSETLNPCPTWSTRTTRWKKMVFQTGSVWKFSYGLPTRQLLDSTRIPARRACETSLSFPTGSTRPSPSLKTCRTYAKISSTEAHCPLLWRRGFRGRWNGRRCFDWWLVKNHHDVDDASNLRIQDSSSITKTYEIKNSRMNGSTIFTSY